MNARELARAVLEATTLTEARAIASRALRPARPSPRAVDAALAAYRLTHWGDEGERPELVPVRCADPSQGILVALGQLESLTYRTTKEGDPPGAHYTHDFASPRPVLAYSDGGLVICGGGYRVTERGIVR